MEKKADAPSQQWEGKPPAKRAAKKIDDNEKDIDTYIDI